MQFQAGKRYLSRAVFFLLSRQGDLDKWICEENAENTEKRTATCKKISKGLSRTNGGIKVRDLRSFAEYKAEKMKDPAFAAEYRRLQPEMAVIRAMIDGREAKSCFKILV